MSNQISDFLSGWPVSVITWYCLIESIKRGKWCICLLIVYTESLNRTVCIKALELSDQIVPILKVILED